MKKLREMVMCAKLVKPDFFVLNGDLTDGHSEKNTIISELCELFENLENLDIPIIICKGNHDSATWYAYENKSAEYLGASEWGYGYLDIEKYKIRAVYLNTSDIKNGTDEYGRINRADACEQWCLGIGEKQLEWLKKTLSECPTDYSVIFFSHYIPYGDKVENGAKAWDIIKKSDEEKRVLAYMYGHKHKDFAETADGIMCICTKDMMNAAVKAADGTEYCATLKDIPVICDEPVLHNPNAHILGGWDYVEITENEFKSRRFRNEERNRTIPLKKPSTPVI